MRTRIVVGVAAAALSVALFPRKAEGCWCGYAGTVGDISITQPMPNFDYCPVDWDPATVRSWATWLVRLDKVLPEGMRLESFDGAATVTTRTGVPRTVIEISWHGDFEALFGAIARLEPDADRVRMVRRRNAQVFTVQALAARSAARASHASERIDRAGDVDSGFFFAGGVPANNPTAHVVSETDTHGRTLHKVLVGAFLDRAAAQASARALARKTGLEMFVRRL